MSEAPNRRRTSGDDEVFDRGLQGERTVLAWQRAALSVAVGSLVLTRLASDRLGAAGVVFGLGGLLVAFLIFVRSHGRHARLGRFAGASHPMPGAALLLTLVTAAVAFGCAALVFVVTTAL